MLKIFTPVLSLALICATSEATASVIAVTAKSDLAGGVGATLVIYLDGTAVGTINVNTTTFTDFKFSTAATARANSFVDVQFNNDQIISGQDRNAYISSITVDGRIFYPKIDAGVVYDVGDGTASFDGINVKKPLTGSAMPWNGALRFPLNTSAPTMGEFNAYTNTVTTGIVAKTGDVISGLKITNPSGACITIPAGVTDVTIVNNDISGCGASNNDPADTDKIRKVGIYINGSDATLGSNVVIRRNLIHDVASGIIAYGGSKHPITIDRNRFYNILGPAPRGQAVQLAAVQDNGTTRSLISCNISDKSDSNIPTHYEDHFSLHQTNNSDLKYNKVRGGDSLTGSGIIVADGRYGSNITVRDNRVLYATNVGISVAGGKNILVADNWVNSAGPNSNSGTSVAYNAINWAAGIDASLAGNSTDVTFVNNRGVARNWITWLSNGPTKDPNADNYPALPSWGGTNRDYGYYSFITRRAVAGQTDYSIVRLDLSQQPTSMLNATADLTNNTSWFDATINDCQ